jgi:uncharacterized membrane protein
MKRMNKQRFFEDLESRLSGLPEQEKAGIRNMYIDFFRECEKNGKPEEEIVYSLLQDFQSGAGLAFAGGAPKENGIRSIVAAVALGFFNLVFVLWVLIAAGSVLFSLLVSSFAMLVAPVWMLLGSGFTEGPLETQTLIYSSLAVLGAGLLLGLGSGTASLWFCRGVRGYWRLNLKLIKGE